MGLSWEPDHVRLDAIRDAYLAEWGDPWALHPVAHAALRLACIGRALSWSRAPRDAPSEAHAQWNHPVTRWIEELLLPAL